MTDTDEYVPTLGDYAEVIDKLAEALGGPATGRNVLPPELHDVYYDAIDRAGMRRVVRAIQRIDSIVHPDERAEQTAGEVNDEHS